MNNRIAGWLAGTAVALSLLGAGAAIAIADDTKNEVSLAPWEPRITWQDPSLPRELGNFTTRVGTLDSVRVEDGTVTVTIDGADYSVKGDWWYGDDDGSSPTWGAFTARVEPISGLKVRAWLDAHGRVVNIERR